VHPLLSLCIVEEAESEAHVDAVDALGLSDGEAAEGFMFAGLSFDVVLEGII
jgi:hypothetical protein